MEEPGSRAGEWGWETGEPPKTWGAVTLGTGLAALSGLRESSLRGILGQTHPSWLGSQSQKVFLARSVFVFLRQKPNLFRDERDLRLGKPFLLKGVCGQQRALS